MTALIIITACAVAAALACWACYVLGRKSGHERGKFDAQLRYLPRIQALEDELRKYRDWHRRQRSPWVSGPPRQIRAKTGPQRLVTRPYTDPASIAPVFAPRPGTQVPMRPQPSGAAPHGDTGTMDALTWTGEMRALMTARTDEFIAGIEAGRAP